MDFDTASRLNILRRACRAKPIETEFMGIYLLGTYELHKIKRIVVKNSPLFSGPVYEVFYDTRHSTIQIELRQADLLQKLVMRYEIPIYYPEFLI